MPIDPKTCEKRAAYCEKLAKDTIDPDIRHSLLEIAAHWRRIAVEHGAIKNLLEMLDDISGYPVTPIKR